MTTCLTALLEVFMAGTPGVQALPFLLAYALLLVVGLIMRLCRINRLRMLFMAGLRMTVQLILAGFLLTYVFAHPHPLFTAAYLGVMTLFTIRTVLGRHPRLNSRFRRCVAVSLAVCGLLSTAFFVACIARQNVFDPQYAIPLAGMLMGNAMTGLSLALKSFEEALGAQQARIRTLVNLSVRPQRILFPLVRAALETALLPTLNSMLGMGIVFLPGMMTGQILAGAAPTTAILYQGSIMMAICATVCLAVLGALLWGYRSLWDTALCIRLPAPPQRG